MNAFPICGRCIDCLDATNSILRVPPRATWLPGPRPTAAGLERHARKFGPAQVAETAAEYGISVGIERPRATRRSRGPSLKERVARLVAAGHGVEVVAEMENLSPARARQLVSEVKEAT